MKNKLFVLSIVLTTFIFSACSLFEAEIIDAELKNRHTDEVSYISFDDELISLILEASEARVEIPSDSNMDLDYVFTVNRDDSTKEHYNLYFDTRNRKTYLGIDDSSTIYEVPNEISESMFAKEVFADAFIHDTLPDKKISINGATTEVLGVYDWSYKNDETITFSRSLDVTGKNLVINAKGTLDDLGETIISIEDSLVVDFSEAPDEQLFKLFENNEVIFIGNTLDELILQIEHEGIYYAEIVSNWNESDDIQYYGSCSIPFEIDVDMPTDIEILSGINYQGDVIAVAIRNSEEGETFNLTSSTQSEEIQIYEDDDEYVAFIPISYWTNEGAYELTLTVNKDLDSEYIVTKPIIINYKEFDVQYLVISEEIVEETDTADANYQYSVYVRGARSESVDEKLWEGPFIQPIEGRLTTDFGEIRYVNDEISSSRHGGIDWAAPTGTEIKASNSGVIALADYMTLTGNTVVIDHGMGIFTTYYHLHTLGSEAGQTVEKGDIIGTVGTTGFSTGPHLHFAFSIYNTNMNPYQAMERWDY